MQKGRQMIILVKRRKSQVFVNGINIQKNPEHIVKLVR